MTTVDEDQLGIYFTIQKIRLIFNDGIRPSDEIDAVLTSPTNTSNIKTSLRQTKNPPRRTREWEIKDECNVFPKDQLQLKPAVSNLGRNALSVLLCTKPEQEDCQDEYEILSKDVIPFIQKRLMETEFDFDSVIEYTEYREHSKLTLSLKVQTLSALRGFDELLAASSSNLDKISQSTILLPDISKIQSIMETIGDNANAVAIVQKLTDAVESFASAHPIAKAAVVALLIPYKLLKHERDFVGDLQDLANDMRTSLTSLTDAQSGTKVESARDSITELFRTLLDASRYICEFADKGRLKRIAKAQFPEELLTFRKRLRVCRENFRESLLVQILVDIGALRNTEAVECEAFIRNRLAPAKQFAASNGCMPGTRKAIFQTVDSWLRDASPGCPNILWISGAPGAGKSAVASSIIKHLNTPRNGVEGGGCSRFFITRKNEDLRDPRSIWRTIAFQLAEIFRSVKTDLLNILSKSKAYLDPQSVDVKTQFTELIKGPLQKLPFPTLSSIPVIVIDALDECGFDSQRHEEDWRQLLDTFDEWSLLPRKCRLIITSRRESGVIKKLGSLRNLQPVVLDTGDAVSQESINDVRHFFKANFSRLKSERNILDPSWPDERDIEDLTVYAAGLFVWAKAAAEFVSHHKGQPVERLKSLMGNLRKRSEVMAQDSDVVQLYEQILIGSFQGLSSTESHSTALVLASLVWMKDTLPREELVNFLAPPRVVTGAQKHQHPSALALHIETAIDNLMPVLVIREPDRRVQVCHKSFLEFLEDRISITKTSTKRDANLVALNRSQQSASFLQSCLQLMNRQLKFNICNMPTSYFPNDLSPTRYRGASIAKFIPESLVYACRYWIDHLLDISELKAVYDEIHFLLEPFLKNHILAWMEVLSLTKSVRDVWAKLLKAANHGHIQKFDRELSDILRDASEFLAKFEPAITLSAPHVYVSALAFATNGSAISKLFRPKYKNVLSLVSGQRSETASRRSPEPFDLVWWISFFANGQYFLSASRDGFLSIHHEYGAAPPIDYPFVTRLPKDIRNINSVAVTNDENLLAIGSVSGKLVIYRIDTDDGSLNRLCETRALKLSSLVFTPRGGGRYLASSSRDGSINFWRMTDGNLENRFGPLMKHRVNRPVNAIAFSPDGSLLVSGSADWTLVIWDTQMGKAADQQLVGHEGSVTSVAWSSDGCIIASGSDDCTVRIWDSDGNLSNTIQMFSPTGFASAVLTVAFSPDARTIVSGTNDRSVRFWDAKSCEPIGEPIHSTYPIGALAFSSNEEHMVSLQKDSSIHLWTACGGTFTPQGPFVKDGEDDFLSMSFDTLGECIITGTAGGYVQVWDIQTRKKIGACRVGRSPVTFVDSVPKSDYIVAASNNTIKHINILSGKLSAEHLPKPLERSAKRIANRHRREAFCRRSLYRQLGLRYHESNNFARYIANALAVSPDGCTLAFALRTREGGSIRLWTIGDRFEYHDDLDYATKCIAFSPDGKFIVSGSENALQLWKVQGKSRIPHRVGLPLRAFGAHEELIAISFSPNGKSLATASTGNVIRIWDLILRDGVPISLNEGRSSASAGTVVPISFKFEEGEDPERVDFEAASNNLKTQFSILDGKRRPAIGDWSYIDEDGWVRNGDSEGYDHLQFWLPPENRAGFWWPRNSAVIARNVTRLNFNRFTRGGDWQLCRTKDNGSAGRNGLVEEKFEEL